MDVLAQITEEDVNVDGQIDAGFLFASIKNTGAAVAQVNGVDLGIGEAKSYPFVGKGYMAVPYTVNGSTLKIMTIV